MALTTTPEVLRELAGLYSRIAALEQAHGLRPGEGAPEGARAGTPDVKGGLHEVVSSLCDDLVVVVTTAGEVVATNQASERFLGTRPEDIVGKNAWAFVHPEDVAAMASARSAPLDDGLPVDVRVLCADGSYRWLTLQARYWPRAEPRYVVLRYRASSSRHVRAGDAAPEGRDEAALERQLRRAAALARVSQLALGLPRVQDVLDAAAALSASGLGVEVGAYLEPGDGGLRVRAEAGLAEGALAQPVAVVMTAAGLVHAGGVPFSSSELARDPRVADPLLAGARAASALAVPVRGTASTHGVLLVAGRAPHRFEEEELHFLETVANVVATAIDGRAAQEALRSRERLARAVFDQAREGLAIVDEEGRCVDANPALERLLGVGGEALRGRRPAEVASTDLDLSGAARRARPLGTASASTAAGPRALEYEVGSEILPGLHLAVVRAVAPRGR
jgi:PAS domain S-box-containing protein